MGMTPHIGRQFFLIESIITFKSGRSIVERCDGVLSATLPEDEEKLSVAFGGGVRVCLSGGYCYAVLFWRDDNYRFS
jgi:hypothetical protein